MPDSRRACLELSKENVIMNFEKITDHIEAVEILGNKRLSVLAKHFGSGCVVFEFAVYQMMSLLCPDYQGGYWAFYE